LRSVPGGFTETKPKGSFKKSFIPNSVGKTKSVAFTESGLRESQRLLAELFAATAEEG